MVREKAWALIAECFDRSIASLKNRGKEITGWNLAPSWYITICRYVDGVRKETADEIAALTAKIEVLQSERDNLMDTVEESPEVIEDAKQETAEEIVDLLIKNDDGDCNGEAIKLIVERYGLQEYIKENFSQFEEADDDGD